MKEFKNDKFKEINQVIGVVVTSDYNLYAENKKKRLLVRFFRDLYFILIAFVVIFSFTSFVLLKFDNIPKKFTLIVELISLFVFIIDFVLHWFTYPTRDLKFKTYKGSYFRYLKTFAFWILLINILPSLYIINVLFNSNFRLLNILQSFKLFRIIRLIMLLNIFLAFKSLYDSILKQKVIFLNLLILVIILILFFSLTVWYTENDYMKHLANEKFGGDIDKAYEANPGTVRTYFDAFYFSCVTLTTIGYGDFTPKSPNTKIILPIISIIGIAIIATPGGIIAASFLNSVQKHTENKIKNQKK
ncbi:ion transporter [Mycoplasmopsis lipofaciens]|uniref:ion transporter n=1 Tax=Mycoplasmopsis lipofaciens TaxID=114884 RepID=UPI00068A2270|nr:ion transporter [Mycoplasmopsis lipofaciens]